LIQGRKTSHGKGKIMKKERRWLKAAIAASTEIQVTLPWARQARRRPLAAKPAQPAKGMSIAAR
jgi:hypothetical protein